MTKAMQDMFSVHEESCVPAQTQTVSSVWMTIKEIIHQNAVKVVFWLNYEISFYVIHKIQIYELKCMHFKWTFIVITSQNATLLFLDC